MLSLRKLVEGHLEHFVNSVKDLEQESERVSERLSEEVAIEQGCE